MPHVRNKPEPGTALHGLDKTDKAQAIAVVGVNNYLALSEKGDIRSFQIKPGAQQLARPARTLSQEGLNGTLKDIHLDKKQNLYAVTREGEIFRQAREHWQQGESGRGWQKLTMPPGESGIDRIETDAHFHPVAVLLDGSRYQLRGETWHPQNASEPTQLETGLRDSQRVFARLNQDMKGGLIPGTGLTIQASAQLCRQDREGKPTNKE